jgi:hypothetical protein
VSLLTQRLIAEYLAKAGHKDDLGGALFRTVKNNTLKTLDKHLHPASVYQDIVRHYGEKVGSTTDVHGFCVHALRATAATNALSHNADIAKVQEWLGHANIATTRLTIAGRVGRRRVPHLRWNTNRAREKIPQRLSVYQEWLPVRLLVTEENGRYLHDAFCMVQHKNNAVPAYAFPVPPLPSPALERDDIAAEGINFELVNGPSNPGLDITGKTCELTLCRIRKFSVPVHV